jgi:hypothetical protein
VGSERTITMELGRALMKAHYVSSSPGRSNPFSEGVRTVPIMKAMGDAWSPPIYSRIGPFAAEHPDVIHVFVLGGGGGILADAGDYSGASAGLQRTREMFVQIAASYPRRPTAELLRASHCAVVVQSLPANATLIVLAGRDVQDRALLADVEALAAEIVPLLS